MINCTHVTVLLPTENSLNVSENAIALWKRQPNTNSYENLANVIRVYKKKPSTNIVSIYELMHHNPNAKVFGNFNEIEYSTNVKFFNVKIKTDAKRIRRCIYNDQIEVYFNELIMSTKYFPNSKQMDANIFTRIDCANNGQNPTDITAKLKVCTKAFNWNNATYKLTAAIEVSLKEYPAVGMSNPSKSRVFFFWNIQMEHEKNKYTFRIAFRQDAKLIGTDNYVCNIECEDLICAAHFVECSDLLTRYYETQYRRATDGAIQPLVSNLDVPDLTDAQAKTLKTFKLVTDDDTAEKSKEQTKNIASISNQMTDFVRYLGIITLHKFVRKDENIKVSLAPYSFDNIVFEQPSDDNCTSESNCGAFNECCLEDDNDTSYITFS